MTAISTRAALAALLVAVATATPEEDLVKKMHQQTGQLRASLTAIQDEGVRAARAAKESFEHELNESQLATSRVEAQNGLILHAITTLRGTNAIERGRAVALLKEVRALISKASGLRGNFSTARAFSDKIIEQSNLANETHLQVLDELDGEEALEREAKERGLVDGQLSMLQLSSRSRRVLNESALVNSLQHYTVELRAALNASAAEAKVAYDKELAAEVEKRTMALDEQTRLNATLASLSTIQTRLKVATAHLKLQRDILLSRHTRVAEFAKALGGGRGLMKMPAPASQPVAKKQSLLQALKPKLLLRRRKHIKVHRTRHQKQHRAHAKHHASKNHKASQITE